MRKPKTVAVELATQAVYAMAVGVGVSVVLAAATLWIASQSASLPFASQVPPAEGASPP